VDLGDRIRTRGLPLRFEKSCLNWQNISIGLSFALSDPNDELSGYVHADFTHRRLDKQVDHSRMGERWRS
jgi:hypothetical protein